MSGRSIEFPSGKAGRTGKRGGGMRMQVNGVSRFEPRPFAEVYPNGATFNSSFSQVRQRWVISGLTKDSTGALLPNCVVALFRTNDSVLQAVETSNENAEYVFTCDGNVDTRFCVAYKVGSPDVAGTTVNTLLPVLT